jgi:hypothetical protein
MVLNVIICNLFYFRTFILEKLKLLYKKSHQSQDGLLHSYKRNQSELSIVHYKNLSERGELNTKKQINC